jgi:bacterioferritin-associated ferredoxin
MYVCVCNAVTEREVGEAIDGGARTRGEVTRACGAGGDCGSCHRMIEDMVQARCGKASDRPDGVLPAAALVRERERAA